ncbi:RNA polymerase II transcription factor SIII subunit A-domain-containing protein [Annulohypoxylon bovei var. microspora]|nr:RNA polymerase II transcription factor SIII subunit A-domain-containing protein [Annulohypoxylon bovei var. microspora]
MVKSLVDLCTIVCIRNIGEIYDVGGAPYSILRPILMKIDNPEHLLQLEELSPHIQGDDAECWQRLINLHFPHQARKYRFEPRNPTLWSKIYQKYKKVEAEEKQEALAKLSNGFKSITKEKQAKAVKAVTFNTRVHGRIPVQRNIGVVARHGNSSGTGGTGGLTWGGGSRTKTNTSQSIMQKARREAAEIARRKQLSTPTGQLQVRQGQITKAPRGMVEEHRIKSLPSVAMRKRQIQAPMRGNDARWERQQKERDARLLKAKSGPITKGATVVSDDDLLAEEDYDDSDLEQEEGGLDVDELESSFYEKKPIASTPTKYAQTPSTPKPGSSLSGLAKMKMGQSWKDKATRIERVVESPKASSSAAPKPSMATSPPPRPSMPREQLSPPAGADPRPKPKLPLKRKPPPSVFMPAKPKARRTS